MKLCNDVITVFTARVDPELGDDVWAPTVIKDVSWYATDASTVDASKGGLVQLVKVLSAEWARDNICVNAVCPGYIDTPLSAKSLNMGDTRRRVLSRIPLGRLGAPEDIGHALAFLASDWSDYITGAAIDVDGGYMACAYTMEG